MCSLTIVTLDLICGFPASDFHFKSISETSSIVNAIFKNTVFLQYTGIWYKIVNFDFLSDFGAKWLSFSKRAPKVPPNSIYGHYDQSIISFSIKA